MRAKHFMESKTGSLAAMTKLERRSISALEKAGVTGVNTSNYGEFWRAYEELKRLDPSVANAGMKYLVLQDISDKQREGMDMSEIVTAVKADLGDIYERSQGWVNAFEEGNPWEIAKAFDGSALISQFINKEEFTDLNNINFHLNLNGTTVQSGNSSEMLFSIDTPQESHELTAFPNQ